MLPVHTPVIVDPSIVTRIVSQFDKSTQYWCVSSGRFYRVQHPMTCDYMVVYLADGSLMPTPTLQEIAQNGTPIGITFKGGHTLDPDAFGYSDTPMVWLGDAVPRCEYVGRTYLYGIHDCLTLVRDYYGFEKKIIFQDQIRTDSWWITEPNMMINGYIERGFETTETPEVGNVVVMRCPGLDNPTHVGILKEDNSILHHLSNRESEIASIRVLERAGFEVVSYLKHVWE